MSFGFAAGLVADLGSAHPAGVLALCWLGVGVCVRAARRAGPDRCATQVVLTGVVVRRWPAVVATLLLTALGDAGRDRRGRCVAGCCRRSRATLLLALAVTPIVLHAIRCVLRNRCALPATRSTG